MEAKRMTKVESDNLSRETRDIPVLASISIFIVSLLCIVGVIWLAFFLFIPKGSWFNLVDGSSMEPTLHDKQVVFTDMTDVTRGDIITSHFPEWLIEKDPSRAEVLVIKRVIGLPGDTIRIAEEGIYVNDQLLEEAYVSEENKKHTVVENAPRKFTLAEDEYFIVGDNREVSYDSRYFGPVKETDLQYKQSEKITKNAAFKGIAVLCLIVADVFVFMVVENVLNKCVRRMMKKTQRTVECN
jgi:signal peptidase I